MALSIISIKIEEYHYFYKGNSLGLEPPQSKEEPVINDPNLKIELVAGGLELPSTMTFIGDND